MACFAAVSTVIAPPISATMAGGVVAVTFLCAASPAMAEAVTWDANWNASDAPSDIPDSNVLSELPSGFTFLSRDGSTYTEAGQTVVRLNGTAADAMGVNIVGGAGMTTADTSVSEGPLAVDTWMKVTGGTYSTLVGGSYAQNYSGGDPASFTGDSHILLSSESGSGTAPMVDYIIGGNYMDAQNAPFTGNSYISVMDGTVNGSIVGGGTSAHIQTAVFNGNSHVWVYTPLSGSAEKRFELPGNFIIGGNAAINNFAPRLEQTGDSAVTIDLSSSSASTAMDKSIVGGAWLLGNTTSTHTGNAAVSITGTASGGADITFAQPVVAGSWFAGGGTSTLSGNTTLTITGGSYAGALVGGAYMAADGTASYTMGNAGITLNSGSVSGNIIGGSYVAAGSSAATQQTGDITLTVNGGTVSGTIYGGSYSMRDNAESFANHGAVNISLAGGTITGNVYAGGGVAAGSQGAVKVASTQVELSDSVVLGASGAGITISGGVENANAASGVAGDRTLLLSGSNYTNLGNATFHGFNVVNNASDVTLKLQSVDSTFTKTGAGKLTIDGANSNLNSISSLEVEKGVLDTDTAWLTQNNNGLTAINIGAGASLMTDGLTLAQGATLALDVSGTPAGALIAEDGAGGLTLLGSKALNLELSQVESIAEGGSVTLLSWSNADAPLTLSNVTWLNKDTGLEAYSLGIVNKSLVLNRADSEELGGGTWDDTSDGKAVIFETPTAGNSTVTVSGDVTPQSVVVNNNGEIPYTFEADASGGSITGDASLTKNGTGGLIMNLENSYSGGTIINGGSVTAGAEGALGTGVVTLNENGELISGQEDAVADNAIVFNGGGLSYEADEMRDLDTATISHEANIIPQVAIGGGNNVLWTYDDAANLQSAIGEGLVLSGGGTLMLRDTTGETIAINGLIALLEEGTTLEFASLGTKQLGTADTPVAVHLAEGTTLSLERPQADTPTTLHTKLTGQGTLEIANTNAAADTTVQLAGNNAAFEGAVNLGTEGVTPAAGATAPAVILDYSQGSPVGDTLNFNGLAFATTQTNGRTTETAADINVNADTTQFAQTAGLDNTFSGDVLGAAEMTWTLDSTSVDGGQTNSLTGDISGFEGTLEANGKQGSIARWVLGSGTVTPLATFAVTPTTELTVNLSAANEYNEFIFNYAEAVEHSGVVSGSANLTQLGTGTLVLTGDNTSDGALYIDEGSTVQLGTEDDAGQWGAAAGSDLLGDGTLNLVNGTLNGLLTLATGSLMDVNVEVAADGNVDLGGNSASLLTGDISVGEGGTLTGVAAGTIGGELDLTLAEENIGAGAAAATAIVQFENGGVGSTLGSTAEAITLDLSSGNVVTLLREHRAAGVESFLTLTNGTLLTAADYSNVFFGEDMDIISDLGLRIARTEGGSLVLNGSAQGVYIAGEDEDPTEVSGYLPLSMYQAVAVMPGETLTLTLDGAPDAATEGEGALVNNLLGGEDSDFVVDNTDTTGEVAVVILNNSVQPIDPVPEGLPGDPKGANTTFGGDISESLTGGDVEFVKTGAGILTVGGGIYAHQLTLQEGAVIFNDDFGSDLDILAMEGGDVQFNDGDNDVDTVTDTDAGGRISLAPDATLTLAQTSTLEDTVIGGVVDNSSPEITDAATTGAGTLEVLGDLTLAEDARLDGVALDIDGGSVTLDGSYDHIITDLDGDGTLGGLGTVDTVGIGITGTEGDFSGELSGNGTLTIAAGAEQSFSLGFAGGAGWNLANNGRMELDFVMLDGSPAPLTLNALSLGSDSVTTMNINPDEPMANLLTLGSISVAPTATVNLSANETDDIVTEDTSYTIGSVSGGQPAGVLTTLSPDADNIVFMLLDDELSTLTVEENGDIRLNLVTSRTNKLTPLASNSNSAAGASMLWNAAFNGDTSVGTDIREVLESLNAGMNAGAADRVLAAVSGASNAVLSAAFSSDMERQLRAIRNRTTMMTGTPRTGCKGQLASDGPRVAAWINGEGDHRKMKADGFLPGYSLSSWGGTVGMDMSCNENLVGGLALTAMYGDLDAHSADNATGDFDRYYISAFSRLKRQRWQHTLLGSVGRLDADLDRTVNYGTGSYRTHGDTKGWGYGLMYEIGYDLPVDEDARFTLQPIANVTWRYVDLDGYTERGSDAGLRVDGHDYNTVTFGAGLRTRGQVGECWFNRSALLEARALVKVDTGDRHGEARVAMLGGGGLHEKVRSARLNAVGVELGAGLSIPLGSNNGAIFIDGSAELRNEYSNLNGTVGYRMEF